MELDGDHPPMTRAPPKLPTWPAGTEARALNIGGVGAL